MKNREDLKRIISTAIGNLDEFDQETREDSLLAKSVLLTLRAAILTRRVKQLSSVACSFAKEESDRIKAMNDN